MTHLGFSANRFSAPVNLGSGLQFGKKQPAGSAPGTKTGFDIPGPGHPLMLQTGEQANRTFLLGFNTLVQMTNFGYQWMRMMGMDAFLPDGSYSRKIEAESAANRRKAAARFEVPGAH